MWIQVYILVVVAIDKEGRRLPFSRGLRTKTGAETAEALESIIKELRCLDPFAEMVRFHTDSGKEFLNKWVSDVLDKYKILGTHTGGHDPKANGLAERFVGYIKGRATSYLAHAKMSLKFWYWACMQATIVYRLSQLDKKLAKGSPTFGEAVLIRYPDAEKNRSM